MIYLYPGKYDWEGSPAHGDCSLRIKVAKHFNNLFLIFLKIIKDDNHYLLLGNFSAV